MGGDLAKITLPPTDLWAQVTKGSVQLFLSTEFIDLTSQVSPTDAATILIYADVVYLNGTFKAPGCNIGIFCRQLIISSSNKFAVIDASGTNGVPEDQKQDGKDGGEITLYVKEMLPSEIGGPVVDAGDQGLFLRSIGGEGALPVGAAAPGKGGAGGRIRVFFGSALSVVVTALDDILESPAQTWQGVVGQLRDTVVTKLSSISSVSLKPDLIAFGDLVSRASTFGGNLGRLDGLIKIIMRITRPRNWEDLPLTIALVALSQTLLALLKADDIGIGLLEVPARQLDDVLKKLSVHDKSDVRFYHQHDLIAQIDKLRIALQSVHIGRHEDTLFSEIDSLRWKSTNELDQMALQFRYTASSNEGGWGAARADEKRVQGNSGSCSGHEISTTKDLPPWLVHPDHCQMLLNRADNAFFSGSVEKRTEANLWYSRLIKSLSSFDFLQESEISVTDPFASGWSDTTYHGVEQLANILTKSQASASRISLDQDFFGRSKNWTPRLSYQFYIGVADALRADLKEILELSDKYNTAYTHQLEAEKTIDVSLNKAKSLQSSAEARIKYLTDANGSVAVSASKIARLSPYIPPAKAGCRSKLIEVAEAIQNHLNIDIEVLLEAGSMMAFSFTKGMGAIQAFGVGNKILNTIKGVDGVTVQKEYIVSQLREVSGDIDELKEQVSQRADGIKEVEDPGATKLLIAEASVKKLITKFVSVIPKELQEDVGTAFKSYIKIVTDRNAAVIEYNTALQYLAQAISDKEQGIAFQKKYGEQKNKLDPQLPATFFYIRKLARDHIMLVMDSLSCCAQSLRFWALTESKPNWELNGNLPNYDMIYTWRDQIIKQFNGCLTDHFALNAGETFSGIVCWLSDGELTSFKENMSEDEETGYKTWSVGIDSIREALATKATPQHGDNSSPFYSRSDVRFTKVACFLEGVQVDEYTEGLRTTKPVTISLQHHGDDIFAAQESDGKEYRMQFQSGGVAYSVRYDTLIVDTKEKMQDWLQNPANNIQNSEPKLPDGYKGTLVPLSPHARWSISITDQYNTGLKMSEVTRVGVIFDGTDTAFMQSS